MAAARFCLVPRGLTPASRRLYEAIASGCAPVVVSDEFRLPFGSWLDYDAFSLRLPEKCLSAGGASARAALEAEEAAGSKLRRQATAVRDLFLYDAPASRAADGILASVLLEKGWARPPEAPPEPPLEDVR